MYSGCQHQDLGLAPLLILGLLISGISPLCVRLIAIVNEVREEKVKDCTVCVIFEECLEEQLLGVAFISTEVVNDCWLVILCSLRRLELDGFEDGDEGICEGDDGLICKDIIKATLDEPPELPKHAP